MYNNNPHTLEALKQNTETCISEITQVLYTLHNTATLQNSLEWKYLH